MEEILKDLGLGDLIDTFKENDITPNVVMMLGDSEFSELGVRTIGDRVRLRERCRDVVKDTNEESPVVKRLKTMLKDRNVKGQRSLFNNRKEKETRRVIVGWKHATDMHKGIFKLMPPNRGGGKQELDIPKSLAINEVIDMFAKTYFPHGINLASGHELKNLNYFIATFTGQSVETLKPESVDCFGDLVKLIGTSPLRLYLHTTEKELFQPSEISMASASSEAQPSTATTSTISATSASSEAQPSTATTSTISATSASSEAQPSTATTSTISAISASSEAQPSTATTGTISATSNTIQTESASTATQLPTTSSDLLQDILDLTPDFSLDNDDNDDLMIDFVDADTPTVSLRNTRPSQNRLRLRRTPIGNMQITARGNGPPDLSMKGILKWWIDTTKVCSEPQDVLVNRMQVLKSTLRVVARNDYNVCKDFNVTFSGEDGDDLGGPKREFFRLLMAEVAANIIQGPFFVHNVDKLNKNDYEMAGLLVAFSILHGGPGFAALHPSVYQFMTDQEPSVYPCIKECIMDIDIREKLEKIEQAETEETYQSTLSEISDWCCEKGLSTLPYKNLADKERLLQVLLKNETIYSVHTEIDQFRRGLNKVGRFFDVIMLAPEQFKTLFCVVDNKPLTFRELRQMYKIQFSKEGSNQRRLENQAMYCLEAYLADCEGGATGVSLAEVLCFWTGASLVPPLGFPKELEVTFGMAQQFPTAHTCNMELNIWRGYADPDVFQDQMTKAIQWSGGFHLA